MSEEAIDNVNEELNSECLTSVKRVRTSALRDEPFWGTIGMGLNVEIGPVHKGRDVETLATDGSSLYVNPEYFMSKTEAKRKTTILHEIAHVALGHHLRRGERDQYLWNIACDHAVNILLEDAGYQIDDEWVCDPGKYRGWSAERVYADISRKEKDKPKKGKPPKGNGKGNPGKGEPGKGQPGKDKPGKEGGDQPDEKKPLEGEVWDAVNKDGSGKAQEEMEKASRDHAKNVEQAKSVMRTAGESSTASFDRALDEVTSPSASWESILSAWWSDRGKPSNETWRRFNRRAMMAGMFMPSTEKKELDHIVIGFDVSYSVGQEEQSVFVSQINSLRELMPCRLITVVPFNTIVLQSEIVEIEQGDDVPSRFKVGGGTRFAPIFNWVRRMDKAPDAVIVFTDLGSRMYGDEPDCNVLWASSVPVWPGDSDITNRPPFGDVVEVEAM